MNFIAGKKVSDEIKEDLKSEIIKNNYKLGLAVIQVGNNEASNIYINQKQKLADYLGIKFIHIKFNENEELDAIKNKLSELNNDENINGIIIQLPLPSGMDTNYLVNLINPSKDIDGLTDYNITKLIKKEPGFIPCTPLGIIKLLSYYNINPSGKNIVIIGRSNLVSIPLFHLLLNMDATVSICHSKTENLEMYTKNADILISATGVKHLITEYMIKKRSVIIDVGISRENGKIYGDVDFDSVKDNVSFITPVPGGVGPMTVVMLMKNLVEGYKNESNKIYLNK